MSPPDRPPIVVNGRFLGARQTGLQRAARRFLEAALDAGLRAEVVVPPGVVDPLADRRAGHLHGRAGAQVWEQVSLPVLAGRRLLVSLANTAPVLARRGVVLVHDLATVVGPQWFRADMRLYGRLSLAAARRAERVITVSRQVADELRDAGVDSDRIRVVANAVDPAFRPAPAQEVDAVRRRLGLERPYLLMVGWADPRKDLPTALAAHRAVFARHPHDLVLVGGSHRNFAPGSTPDGPGVKVVGYLDDHALVPLLCGAAALVYPSRYEGFGLPPVEALACGVPALVSELPAVVEATGGEAVALPVGDVSAWADAIERALDGRIVAGSPPRWSWSDAGRALLAVLEEVEPGVSG